MENVTSGKKTCSTRDIVFTAVFAAMLAVCSWISVPAPPPFSPFTMQTFGIFVTILMLGAENGFLAILTFILMGAAGLPVFAGFTGGLGVIAGTTGGYMVGFLFAAPIYGIMTRLLGDKSIVRTSALILGLIVCYAFGTAWFMVVYTRQTGAVGLTSALIWCVVPFILPDAAKLILALGVSSALKKRIRL